MKQTIIEELITALIICTQLGIFWFSYKKVQALKRFFPNYNMEDYGLETALAGKETVRLLKIDEQFPAMFRELLKSINNYLKKNKGLTGFEIIKNMIDRRIESLENEISGNINLPLYIGLMGTFLGIIIGLRNITISDTVAEQNVNLFLGGVVTAMTGSLTGLGLTVINNSIVLKDAKKVCDSRKNIFYDFLQAELLPHLQHDLFDVLERLKDNITGFNDKFETNIDKFDEQFGVKIDSLKESVTLLADNIGNVVKNTLVQQAFLEELKRIGYNEMAATNLKVFNSLNSVLPTINIFIEKQKELTVSVEHAAGFVGVIDRILDRVKTFEKSLNGLGDKIQEPEYLGNQALERIDKNLHYLEKQYETLKQYEVISSERIKTFFDSQYSTISHLTDHIKREVEDALTINIKDNPFQKLHLLNGIEDTLKTINEKISGLEIGIKELPFQKLDLLDSVENALTALNVKVDPGVLSKDLKTNTDRIENSIKDLAKKMDNAGSTKRSVPTGTPVPITAPVPVIVPPVPVEKIEPPTTPIVAKKTDLSDTASVVKKQSWYKRFLKNPFK